jgi:ABC-type dipeptide/oligopeptide/nickel transport system permease component
MQYSLRFALLVVVALGICFAQTATCWPPLGQEAPLVAVWAGTIALCAAWMVCAAMRHHASARIRRRLGLALVAIASFGCWWGMVLLAFAGFSLFGAVPAEEITRGRTRAALLIAPASLLLVWAIASVWGARVTRRPNADRKTILVILAAILAAPLPPWIGLVVFDSPILGALVAAVALGAFVLDGGMGDKEEHARAQPQADGEAPPATSDDSP